ncbi:hypothetical protein DEO72_LG2g4132 [Vigna unguiculata]|uniref:Uncharacterized protein n=1 Tax=Vigna unguiculata TaxID=3917 RepID=A0A4D6L5R1_VIGUN|nr:hypothetical protein DEO72_LG2g4132 [Vigna unguiculata]
MFLTFFITVKFGDELMSSMAETQSESPTASSFDAPCGSHCVCSWPQHHAAMDAFSHLQFWSQEEANAGFANLNLHTLSFFTFHLCHLLG